MLTSRSRFERSIILLMIVPLCAIEASLHFVGVSRMQPCCKGCIFECVAKAAVLQRQPLCANMIAALQRELCLFLAIENASFAPCARSALEHTGVHHLHFLNFVAVLTAVHMLFVAVATALHVLLVAVATALHVLLVAVATALHVLLVAVTTASQVLQM